MAIDLNKTNFTQPLLSYLRTQQDNKRFMHGIEIAVTFFVIALFGIFAISPTLLTISALIGENKAKQKSIAEMKVKINNIIKAQDVFAQAQDSFSLIDSTLPTDPNYGDVASQIEGVARQSGIVLEKINYNLVNDGIEKVIPAKTDAFSVVSSNKNSFGTSTTFISNLLKNRRLFDFSTINFTIPKEGTGNNLEFSFTANFLNFKTVTSTK